MSTATTTRRTSESRLGPDTAKRELIFAEKSGEGVTSIHTLLLFRGVVKFGGLQARDRGWGLLLLANGPEKLIISIISVN